MNMKRAELALNTIIVAVIALLVLVVLIILFTRGSLNFWKGAGACDNAKGVCGNAVDGKCPDGNRHYAFGDSQCIKDNKGDICCVPEGLFE